jgi:ribosomal protein L11 methyltransferase
MPYRIDVCCPASDAIDVLVELGALDVEAVIDGVAAILPDRVPPETLAAALGVPSVTVSAAVARDNGSVWLLGSRPVRIGSILIGSPGAATPERALRLTDSNAFGTGHHPTTVLCVEALEEILAMERAHSVLDVGTGSGILALTALLLGVPEAVGLDIDADALKVAAQNARLNNLAGRLHLVHGGPSAVDGQWPLVIANVLAAPLIEMAPILVRRVGKRGRLILSGIPRAVESEVRQAYQHLGIRHISSKTRAGWTVLMAEASW